MVLEANFVSLSRYSEAGLRAHSIVLSPPPARRVRFQAVLHVAIINTTDTTTDTAAEKSRHVRRRSGSKAMTAEMSTELHSRHAETQKHLISCVEAKAEAKWGAIPEEEDMVPCPNCGVHVHPIHRRRKVDIICGTCFLLRNADVAIVKQNRTVKEAVAALNKVAAQVAEHDDRVWKTYPCHQRLLFTVVGIDWWGIGEALAEEKRQAGPRRAGSISKPGKTEYVFTIAANDDVVHCKRITIA